MTSHGLKENPKPLNGLFRLEIFKVGKFPTLWNLTKLQDFGTHAYLSMRGPTLPFAPTKTYGLIAVNLREKLEFLSLEIFFFSRTPLCLFLLTFLFFFYHFFWIHGSNCAMCSH